MGDPDLLDIPAFLRRATRALHPSALDDEPEERPWVMPAQRRTGPTKAERESMALAVVAAVAKGADTFGKLHKRFPTASKKLLRSGIRRALASGRIARDGRRYRPRCASGRVP
jgi:hypothetical protein